MKPTREELLKQTRRGGRVFLFEYPPADLNNLAKGCLMPSYQANQEILDTLLRLPGCKEVGGPYANGILTITVDDQEAEAALLTDEQWQERIVYVILRHWRG